MRTSIVLHRGICLLALVAATACGSSGAGPKESPLGAASEADLGPCNSTQWTAGFSDTYGWSSNRSYWKTVQFANVNDDSSMDVCGRWNDGIHCEPSTGSSFTPAPAAWDDAFFSDVQGWGSDPSYWGTIQLADIDGDGKGDVCGRGVAGIYCALSTGTSFQTGTRWNGGFQDADGWNSDASYWQTIRLTDVNGDGKADVCGRGKDGIYCAVSTGTNFVSASMPWDSGFFSDVQGWKSDSSHWKTIQFADVDGDGKADVCGRGVAGMYCALSTGTSFQTATLWTGGFQDAYGWNSDPSYWQTIQLVDVNGDGMADVCGRGPLGIYCEVSTGTSFTPATTPWTSQFSDAGGWNLDPSYWGTIQFADVDGDGKADVCGRQSDGVYCALSTGTSFQQPAQPFAPSFSDSQNWNSNEWYWSTIRLVDVNGDRKADVCGRGPTGMMCALSRYGDNTCPSP